MEEFKDARSIKPKEIIEDMTFSPIPSGQSLRRKTWILGIAPYEGMKTIMQRLARERDDIMLDVYVGDLNEGASIVRRNSGHDYDVIISRGGTAELIGQITTIPVIEVTLSVYDILRAIKLAENYSERYAIVGFPGITSNAHLLCDLLQYKIDIFTVHNAMEVEEILKDLKERGYRMVLCDMIATTVAKRLKLNALLITSGNESISSAFDQAVKISAGYASVKEENQFLRSVIRSNSHHTVILKENGDVFFSTLDENQFPQLREILLRELPAVLHNETHKFFKNLEGTLYAFTCKRILYLGAPCGVFYFSSSSVPLATSKYGIQYTNVKESEDYFFNSFYSVTSSSSNMQATIENINQTSFPVMLSGEAGSGKEQIARALYSQGSLRNNPLITINCALVNDRSWNFITNHYNSPFNDNDNTIFLKDITALPESRLRQLLSIMVDMNLCKRNRIIFSCICPQGKGLPSSALEFVNLLSCITIHLSPLRERASDIPTLSSLYLNTLNVSMANQIIGFEPEAMNLLQHYDWPYNYTQFKRILNELALITTTPYIRAIHVAELLEKESSHLIPSPDIHTPETNGSSYSLNLNRSLDEISQDIIRQVLAECGGNQSAAAKRLKISRSTLWRVLNR